MCSLEEVLLTEGLVVVIAEGRFPSMLAVVLVADE